MMALKWPGPDVDIQFYWGREREGAIAALWAQAYVIYPRCYEMKPSISKGITHTIFLWGGLRSLNHGHGLPPITVRENLAWTLVLNTLRQHPCDFDSLVNNGSKTVGY